VIQVKKSDPLRLLQRMPRWTWYVAGVVLALAGSAWYLWQASRCAEVGFPLDDPWIHQTYARNLARTGRLVYAGDQISAGSTSPLWTLLLALGHRVGAAPLLWTYLLGGLGWLALAWTCGALVRRLFPAMHGLAPLVTLACLAEWHLAWAALSGMEITLFTWLSILLIERYVARVRPIWVGLVGGALVWARPEGIVLVGLVLGAAVIEAWCSWRNRRQVGSWVHPLAIGTGFAALLVPYVVWNVLLWGAPLPTTFYAKYAEYQALLGLPFGDRLLQVAWPPLVGAQVLLAPGFVWQVAVLVRQPFRASRQRFPANPNSALVPDMPGAGSVQSASESPPVPDALIPIAWWAAYHLVFALRLPVGYHHGRYLMPTIPILLLYGIAGTADWLRRLHSGTGFSILRVLRRAAVLAVCCLFVAFLFLGGRTYALDVCIIQGEMVDVAMWLRANTSRDALVATHDIGAIGYFAERPLLDLAGLVTPQVIPFIRDETRLLDYILGQGAEYLVTFPAWYPHMVGDDRLSLVYQSDCALSRETLGDNMAVYRVTD
jgi:hypothetical protein